VLAEHGGAAGQGEVAESLRAAARKVRLGAQAAAQEQQQLLLQMQQQQQQQQAAGGKR
jgi:hypothetical protein